MVYEGFWSSLVTEALIEAFKLKHQELCNTNNKCYAVSNT
jgi:hypothetical protein